MVLRKILHRKIMLIWRNFELAAVCGAEAISPGIKTAIP
jgi:hypothetical protein